MAYITVITCIKCHKQRQVTLGAGQSQFNAICGECKANESDRKRREHFGKLDGLTTEERLRKVEEWIYNYKPYREPRF